MTDTQAYLEGFAAIHRLIQDGLEESETRELAMTAVAMLRVTDDPAYWHGVSAGVAAALGV